MKDFKMSEEPTEQPGIESQTANPLRPEATGDVSTDAGNSQCEMVKPDGERCRAHSLVGRSLCFFHDASSAEARTTASSRGGLKKHPAVLPPGTPDFALESSADAAAFLARTTNQLLRGEVDPKIANSAGYLIGLLMKALETNRLEERLTDLETIIQQQQPRRDPL